MNARAFAPVSAADLMDGGTPARRELLSPLLASSSSVLVYGPRGVGKTLFALGIAWAAASGGSFLGWRAPRAHRVTYIDGELGGDDMRGRLALFGAVPPSLQFFLADRGGPPLDLTRLDNQHRLMEQWGDPELVVFDSPSSLAALCSSDSTRWKDCSASCSARRSSGGRCWWSTTPTGTAGRAADSTSPIRSTW